MYRIYKYIRQKKLSLHVMLGWIPCTDSYIYVIKFLHTVLYSNPYGIRQNQWHIFTVLGKSELKAGSIQHKTDCTRLKIAPEDCRNCYKGQTEKKQLQSDEICGVNFIPTGVWRHSGEIRTFYHNCLIPQKPVQW